MDERRSTQLDRIADGWLDTLVELSPELGITLGRPGGEGLYTDHSPDGHAAATAAAEDTLAQTRRAVATDPTDEVTKAELERTLTDQLDLHRANLWQRDLNVIASPVQSIRDVFDLMATDTDEQWSHVEWRMRNVAWAMDGYIASLRAGIDAGNTPAVRQVEAVLDQVTRIDRPDGFFLALAARGPDSLRRQLDRSAGDATAAYARLGHFLRHELAPVAGTRDAVGREAYALLSRTFIGMPVDLDETYAWGVDELARTVTEQERLANEIVPGGGLAEAISHLDADPSTRLHGTDALRQWMQDTSDAAIADLGRTHFDIPEPLRRLECMIAPTQDGGIYYTAPTEDFSRPGRMWWSVPPGVTEFSTWRELTTVHHEGVPGHHLQLGTALLQPLNAWRRFNWNSGHGEGWALYAERLMDDLGHLPTPGDRLGMLDAQRMRAARVVIDIGVHLALPKPDGTGPWTGDDAYPFLARHLHMDDGFVRFEANRYLGWAGQAPSYKVGQREWERLRDDWTAQHGDDPKAFHAIALAQGSVGLQTLRSSVLG